MAIKAQQSDAKHFVIKRSEFNTAKLFAEFYLPEYQTLLNTLRQGRYPLRPLREISIRLFDGPFGSDRKVDMYQESGIPYVRVKQVQHEGIDLSGLVYISQEKHEALIRSRIVPGNVLMTIAGSQLGKAAVFPNTFKEGNITGHIVGIEVKDDINPYYLAVFINSQFGKEQVTRWSHRSTRRELNLNEVGQILVPLPPRNVQDYIAKLMHEAYDKQQYKLTEARKLLGKIDTLVSHQLGINIEKLPQERRYLCNILKLKRWDITYSLPYYSELEKSIFSGIYPVHNFGKLVKFVEENIEPRKKPEFPILYIEIGDINPHFFEVESFSKILGKNAPSRARFLVKAGDIVTGVSGVLTGTKRQSTFIVSDELNGAVVSNGFVVLQPIKKVLSEYVFALLVSQFFLDMIWRRKTGAAIPAISDTDFKSIPTPLPPIEAQKKIAHEVNCCIGQAKKLRAETETLVAEAKARVQRMILGEEDVA